MRIGVTAGASTPDDTGAEWWLLLQRWAVVKPFRWKDVEKHIVFKEVPGVSIFVSRLVAAKLLTEIQSVTRHFYRKTLCVYLSSSIPDFGIDDAPSPCRRSFCPRTRPATDDAVTRELMFR